jgi:hypothetical protein
MILEAGAMIGCGGGNLVGSEVEVSYSDVRRWELQPDRLVEAEVVAKLETLGKPEVLLLKADL